MIIIFIFFSKLFSEIICIIVQLLTSILYYILYKLEEIIRFFVFMLLFIAAAQVPIFYVSTLQLCGKIAISPTMFFPMPVVEITILANGGVQGEGSLVITSQRFCSGVLSRTV